MKNPLILCIDLDEWYHGRWATGSSKSRWKTTQDCFRKYYQSDAPGGEIIKPTHQILKILKKEKIKATFFILGEVAEWYPELVKKIAHEGHEIACHGMHHRDLTLFSMEDFAKELAKSRQILRKLSGQKVLGFRSPNLIVTRWLGQVLIKQNFTYDSSVCPSRNVQGKNRNQVTAQTNPYRVSENSMLKKGDSSLIEIPIPTFPVLKLPGAVSIATRIFGWWWTKITLDYALKTGAACFYLHPYEFNPIPKIPHMKPRERLIFRRAGQPMTKIFEKLLKQYRGRIISAEKFVTEYFKE